MCLHYQYQNMFYMSPTYTYYRGTIALHSVLIHSVPLSVDILLQTVACKLCCTFVNHLEPQV